MMDDDNCNPIRIGECLEALHGRVVRFVQSLVLSARCTHAVEPVEDDKTWIRNALNPPFDDVEPTFGQSRHFGQELQASRRWLRPEQFLQPSLHPPEIVLECEVERVSLLTMSVPK